MRSQAHGTVRLASIDPRHSPNLSPNYMSGEKDFPEFRRCIQLSREIFAQSAFDEFRGEELAPGAHCNTDAEVCNKILLKKFFKIDNFVREKAASAYHPSCSAKMGKSSDKMAVVDPKTMNVYGFEGLKVLKLKFNF